MSRAGGLSSGLAAARLAGGGSSSKSVSLQTNPDDQEDFQPRDMQFTLLPLAHSSKSGTHNTRGRDRAPRALRLQAALDEGGGSLRRRD